MWQRQGENDCQQIYWQQIQELDKWPYQNIFIGGLAARIVVWKLDVWAIGMHLDNFHRLIASVSLLASHPSFVTFPKITDLDTLRLYDQEFLEESGWRPSPTAHSRRRWVLFSCVLLVCVKT